MKRDKKKDSPSAGTLRELIKEKVHALAGQLDVVNDLLDQEDVDVEQLETEHKKVTELLKELKGELNTLKLPRPSEELATSVSDEAPGVSP